MPIHISKVVHIYEKLVPIPATISDEPKSLLDLTEAAAQTPGQEGRGQDVEAW